MRTNVFHRRLDRRRFLTGAVGLSGAAFALSRLRSARADGEDSSGTTIVVPVPDDVSEGEHWVDVNLTQQVAAAMSGSEIVRLILVTTGQPGWETPEGQFRILYRVADERMASSSLGIPFDSADGYDLDHVLWTQYFTDQGHALHDNYWRPASVFGHDATSHGCVGMVESDARFLWSFVGNGSLVNIHSEAKPNPVSPVPPVPPAQG
jgi:hypothetical protein